VDAVEDAVDAVLEARIADRVRERLIAPLSVLGLADSNPFHPEWEAGRTGVGYFRADLDRVVGVEDVTERPSWFSGDASAPLGTA